MNDDDYVPRLLIGLALGFNILVVMLSIWTMLTFTGEFGHE